MRFKTVLALFLLVAIGWAAGKLVHLRRHGVDPEASLFRMPLSELEWVEMHIPEGEALSFYRDAGSWWVTDGRRGFSIPTDSMNRWLERIWSVVPQGISPAKEGTWLSMDTATARFSLRFTGKGGQVEQFSLLVPKSRNDQAWIQFAHQEELLRVAADPWQPLCRSMSAYARGHLLGQPISVPPDSLLYLVPADSTRVLFRFREGKWLRDSIPLIGEDSLTWMRYLNKMADWEALEYADDFDETSADLRLLRRIVFWSDKQARVISCFGGNSRREPFVIHTSSRAGEYFRSDSGGLFRTVFAELDSLVKDSVHQNYKSVWR